MIVWILTWEADYESGWICGLYGFLGAARRAGNRELRARQLRSRMRTDGHGCSCRLSKSGETLSVEPHRIRGRIA